MMTTEEANRLIADLDTKEKAAQDPNEKFQFYMVKTQLQEWRDTGFSTPPEPQLAAWMKENSTTTSPSLGTPDSAGSSSAPVIARVSQWPSSPTVTSDPTQSDGSQNGKSHAPTPPGAASPVREVATLNEADRLLESHSYVEVIRILQQEVAQNPSNTAYKERYDKAVRNLRAGLTELFSKAEVASTRGDQTEAQRLLKQILDITQDTGDVFREERTSAERQLSALSRSIGETKQNYELDDVKRKLRGSANDLKVLEENIALARNLIGSGQVDEELETLLEKAQQRRAQLLEQMGQLDTMRGANQLKEYIDELSRLLSAGTLEYYSQREGRYIETARALADARAEYAVFCEKKAGQKKERAAQLMPHQPTAALYEIEDALQTLDVLPPDTKEILSSLQREYSEAKAKFEQADEERKAGLELMAADADKALVHLQRARSIYSTLPDLEGQIAEAYAELGRSLAGRIENLLEDTARLARLNKLIEARGKVDEARDLLQRVPQNYLGMDDIRERMKEVSAKLTDQEAAYEQAQTILAQVEDATRQEAYARAITLLNSVPEPFATMERAQGLRTQIAELQGPTEQLDEAQRLLTLDNLAEHYTEITRLLNLVLDPKSAAPSKLRERAIQLKRQAETEHTYHEGLRLFKAGQWEQAESTLEKIVRDGGTQRVDEARKQLVIIANKKVAKERWDRIIKRSQDAREKDDLEKLAKTLIDLEQLQEEVGHEYSPLQKEWETAQVIYQDLAKERVRDLLDGLSHLGDTSAHVQQRFEKLHEAWGILEAMSSLRLLDDYILKKRVEIDLHRSQANLAEVQVARGIAPIGVNWESVLKLWDQVSDKAVNDLTTQEEVKDAHRRVVLLWAEELASANNPDKAYEVIAAALERRSLKNDVTLLERAIELCLDATKLKRDSKVEATAILNKALNHARHLHAVVRNSDKAAAASQRITEVEEELALEEILKEVRELVAQADHRKAVALISRAKEDYPRHDTMLSSLTQVIVEDGIRLLNRKADTLDKTRNLSGIVQAYAAILDLVKHAPTATIVVRRIKEEVEEKLSQLKQNLDNHKQSLLREVEQLRADINNPQTLRSTPVEALSSRVDKLAADLSGLVDVEDYTSTGNLNGLQQPLETTLKYQQALRGVCGKLNEAEEALRRTVEEDKGAFDTVARYLEDAETTGRPLIRTAQTATYIRLAERLDAESAYWKAVSSTMDALWTALDENPQDVEAQIQAYRKVEKEASGREGLTYRDGDKQAIQEDMRFSLVVRANLSNWKEFKADGTTRTVSSIDELSEIARQRADSINNLREWLKELRTKVEEARRGWLALKEEEKNDDEEKGGLPLNTVIERCTALANLCARTREILSNAPEAFGPKAQDLLREGQAQDKTLAEVEKQVRQRLNEATTGSERVKQIIDEVPKVWRDEERRLQLIEEGLALDPSNPTLRAWRQPATTKVGQVEVRKSDSRENKGLFGRIRGR